jgi:hypothetical protein
MQPTGGIRAIFSGSRVLPSGALPTVVPPVG